jgi:hypothetical protein
MTLLLFVKMKYLILEHHHHHHHLHPISIIIVNSRVVRLRYWCFLCESEDGLRLSETVLAVFASSHFTRPNGMSLVAGGLLTYFSDDFVNFVLKSWHPYSYVCNLQYVVLVRIS